MNCQFNENNPMDRPGIVKFIRKDTGKVKYMMTALAVVSNDTAIDYLRRTYVRNRVEIDTPTFEIIGYNISEARIKDFVNYGELPEGMYFKSENEFLKRAFEIFSRLAPGFMEKKEHADY